ncbi:hypothetical protein BGW38_002694 [Lunasporangiospora selenospora]|uniref:N-acetyltransferase domain-containing protein n=1 Tax=Lunasporangiospora selenospora TaxID=979761 RepID=A0A9P6FRP4_9FUNG|nr:hypothetical protein BGW38_002694 [Lunasporangiospora selenospora]
MTVQSPTAQESAAVAKATPRFYIQRCSREEAYKHFFGLSMRINWNPAALGEDIRDVYYNIDPQGFFVGKLSATDFVTTTTPPSTYLDETYQGSPEDRVVCMIGSVRFNSDQGWVGYYVVDPDFRGQGYGVKIFDVALDHLAQTRSVGLYGVLPQVENYRKSGFTLFGWTAIRHQGSAVDLYENRERELALQIRAQMKLKANGPWRSLLDQDVDLQDLIAIDYKATGLVRPGYIQDWVRFHSERSDIGCYGVALVSPEADGEASSSRKSRILGYACVRRGEQAYRVGPLYATSPEVAKQILVQVTIQIIDGHEKFPPERQYVPLDIDIDVPESNQNAISLYKGYDWTQKTVTRRMWRGPMPNADSSDIYGVTTMVVG